MSERKRFYELFTPSWLSLLICIVSALTLCAWVVLTLILKNGGYSQLILHPNGIHTQQSVLTLPGQTVAESGNSLQNTWPLIVFWGFIGLIVYFVVDLLISLVNDVKRFNRQLDYVHAKRDAMIKTTIETLGVRLVAVILWLFFLDYFSKRIIPHCINLSHHSIHAGNIFHAVGDIIVALVIIAVCMHINTIFLRIAVRKSRVFGSD
jgi:hypothetical protein